MLDLGYAELPRIPLPCNLVNKMLERSYAYLFRLGAHYPMSSSFDTPTEVCPCTIFHSPFSIEKTAIERVSISVPSSRINTGRLDTQQTLPSTNASTSRAGDRYVAHLHLLLFQNFGYLLPLEPLVRIRAYVPNAIVARGVPIYKGSISLGVSLEGGADEVLQLFRAFHCVCPPLS